MNKKIPLYNGPQPLKARSGGPGLWPMVLIFLLFFLVITQYHTVQVCHTALDATKRELINVQMQLKGLRVHHSSHHEKTWGESLEEVDDAPPRRRSTGEHGFVDAHGNRARVAQGAEGLAEGGADVPPQPHSQRPSVGNGDADPEPHHATLDPHYQKHGLVNGVIVILLNKNAETKRLAEQSLRLMSAHFLECFPYDVHIFHEHQMTERERESIQSLVPSSRVTFEFIDIPHIPLPAGLKHEEVKPWNSWGLGYRQMCRFFSGLVFKLPSLQKYDWYWRMDTDSWYTDPLDRDPFRRVIEKGCSYAYIKVRSDDWFVTKDLWKTYLNHTRENKVPQLNVSRVKSHTLDPKDPSKYMATMFETNFEIGDMSVFRSEEYQKIFEYHDTHPPYGFLRHRWGDAPFRVLGVRQLLPDPQTCDMKREIPYAHGKRSMGRKKRPCRRAT